jgi:hypothetical protein
MKFRVTGFLSVFNPDEPTMVQPAQFEVERVVLGAAKEEIIAEIFNTRFVEHDGRYKRFDISHVEVVSSESTIIR